MPAYQHVPNLDDNAHAQSASGGLDRLDAALAPGKP
jgi:hypothetical protein